MKSKLQIDFYSDPKYVPHVLCYYLIGNGHIAIVAKKRVRLVMLVESLTTSSGMDSHHM